MNNIKFIIGLIYAIFFSSTFYSQNLQKIKTTNYHERYKSITVTDTIKIVIYDNNCFGCIKDKILFFYNENILHVVFEDSFITKLHIVKDVSSSDSMKLHSILKKSENNKKIKKREYDYLNKMISNGSFKLLQKASREKLFLYNLDFETLRMKLESMESFFQKKNLNVYERYRINMVSFDITSQYAISYFSNIDAKEYILNVILSDVKPIR